MNSTPEFIHPNFRPEPIILRKHHIYPLNISYDVTINSYFRCRLRNEIVIPGISGDGDHQNSCNAPVLKHLWMNAKAGASKRNRNGVR